MPPTFTLIERGYVSGAELWLFAVPDGDPAGTGLPVMLSTEARDSDDKSNIVMGRVDPLDPSTFSNVQWSTIAVHFEDVTDHWHLCIKGEHWLSYSYKDDHLQLFKIAAADVEEGVVPIEQMVVTPLGGGGLVETAAYKTNDHFMMRRKGGVAVGAWDGSNIKMIVIDDDLNLRAEADIDDSLAPANGSSAVRVKPDEAHVMASTSLSFSVEGQIKYFKYRLTDTERWTEGTLFLTIEDPGYNCSMATVVVLANDWTVITFRRVPVREGAEAGVEDGGSIIRHVYNPSGGFHSGEKLLRSPATL